MASDTVCSTRDLISDINKTDDWARRTNGGSETIWLVTCYKIIQYNCYFY